jgi:hypothetical protein
MNKRLTLAAYNKLPKHKQVELIKKCYNFPKLKVRTERTATELAEGCIYFINNFCEIYDKEVGEYVPFMLYPVQEDYIRDYFEFEKLIINKSRQCGFTWVTCGILIYNLLFMDGQQCLVLSKTGEDSFEVIRRIKSMLDRLPDFMRPDDKSYKVNTKKQITLQDRRLNNGSVITGSSIKSATTAEGSGRGGNFTNIMWDEAAHVDKKVNCQALYNSISPTLSKNGKFVINSTPNGLGNFYSEMFLKAEAGENGFHVFKFHWAFDPHRCVKWFEFFENKRKEYRKNGKCYCPNVQDDDYKLLKEEEWYIKKFMEMGSEDDFNQEYELSFLNSGRPAFNLVKLKQLYEQDCLTAVTVERRLGNKCDIYAFPVEGMKYIAVLDTAENKGGDASVLLIFDRNLNQVVEYVDNKEDLANFFYNVLYLLKEYNGSYCLFELNNTSGGYIQCLFEESQYPFVYTDWDAGDGRPGLRTTTATKNLYIQALRELLYTKSLKLKSYKLYEELTRFCSENGKFGAPNGYHDDRVMALSFLTPAIEDFSMYGDETNTVCI